MVRIGYSLIALSALFSGSAKACTQPDPSTVCELSYDPVNCSGCYYDNACLAEAAGQTNCEPGCPAPDANIACTTEFAPVACGGFVWCLYPNLCTAEAAGKTQADCERSCPTVPDNTACTQEYDPYFCGGCFYDSQCLAKAAWVDGAGLPESSCVQISPKEPPAECAEPDANIACDRSYAPVDCGNDCIYDNTCLAEAAGQTDCPAACPTIPDGTACTLDYQPVVCDGCVYDNTCLAEAAGHSPDNCSSSCPAPGGEVACTDDFAPVYCNGCVYSNDCLATAAGFTGCQSIDSPTVQQTSGGDSGGSSGGVTPAMKVSAAAVLLMAPFMA